MTELSQYVPVTHAAAVENKIQNSVKISKQLMKSELKRRIGELDAELDQAETNRRLTRELFEAAAKTLIKRETTAIVGKDGELTRMRNFFNKFSTVIKEEADHYFDTNADMIRDIDTTHAIGCMTGNGHYAAAFPDDHRAYTEHGLLPVSVELHIRDYESSTYHAEDYLGFTIAIPTHKSIEALRDTAVEAKGIATALNTKLHDLRQKLEGIDQVAEQMEAQLLVQELGKTDEGKEALRTAGELVGEMLGETPMLLRLEE